MVYPEFKDAYMGMSYRHADPFTEIEAYNYAKCVEILQNDMTYEEAVEYLDFNYIHAFIGEKTPVFLYLTD